MSDEVEPLKTFKIESTYRQRDTETHDVVTVNLEVRVPKNQVLAATQNALLKLINSLRGSGWVEF